MSENENVRKARQENRPQGEPNPNRRRRRKPNRRPQTAAQETNPQETIKREVTAPEAKRSDEPRTDRTDRAPRERRRPRRTPRETIPIVETFEDVSRDNIRIEKEIRLDIEGFSQITLDL